MASHAARRRLGLGLTEALAISIETGRARRPVFRVIETIVAPPSLLGQVRPEAAAEVVRGEALATCATSGAAEPRSFRQPAGWFCAGRVTVPFAHGARWLALPVRGIDGNEPGPWAAVLDLSAPGNYPSPLPPIST